MNVNLNFRSLGIVITPKTPQTEIDAHCKQFPEIKKLLEKLTDGKKESKTK